MELTIDMSGKDVRVTRPAQAKLDQRGEQRTEKETGQPLWTVQARPDGDGGPRAGEKLGPLLRTGSLSPDEKGAWRRYVRLAAGLRS